jgi:integrase
MARKKATRKKATRRTQKGQAWFRALDGCWYCTTQGKRTKLRDVAGNPIRGKDEKGEADKAVARLRLGLAQPKHPDKILVSEVLDGYLQYLQSDCTPEHYRNTLTYLSQLNAYCGGLEVSQLKRKHVLDWLKTQKGLQSDNSKRRIIGLVLAAFNHAVKNEDSPIDSNPLAGIKQPAAFGRVTAFLDCDLEELFAYLFAPPRYKCVSLAPIGDSFQVLLHTGARPSELASVTADDVIETESGMMLRLVAGADDNGNYRHKTAKKTGKTRQILLNNEAETIVKRLVELHPTGKLFRTPRGAAWTRVSWVNHFRTIRRKLGWNDDSRKAELSTYTFRHTFAKRVLTGFYGAKADLYVVAGLLGNTHKVCEQAYAQWCDGYMSPLWQAIGK